MGGKKTVGSQPTRGNFLNYGRSVPRGVSEGERNSLAPFFVQDFSLFSQLEFINGATTASGSHHTPGLAGGATTGGSEYWGDGIRDAPRKPPAAPLTSVEQLQINDLQSQVEKLESTIKDIELSASTGAGGGGGASAGASAGKPVDLKRIYELMRTIEGRQRAIQSKLSHFDNLFGHTSENWLEAVDKILYIFQFFDYYRYHGYPPSVTPSGPMGGPPAAPPSIVSIPFAAYPPQMAPTQAPMPPGVYTSVAPPPPSHMHHPSMHPGVYSSAAPTAAIDMSGYYATTIAGYPQYQQSIAPHPRAAQQPFMHSFSSGSPYIQSHPQMYPRHDDAAGSVRKTKKQAPIRSVSSSDDLSRLNNAKTHVSEAHNRGPSPSSEPANPPSAAAAADAVSSPGPSPEGSSSPVIIDGASAETPVSISNSSTSGSSTDA
jgi:hypothetical protein